MTEAQLQNVFKRHGLAKVDPLNEKFDPNVHEALFQQVISFFFNQKLLKIIKELTQ